MRYDIIGYSKKENEKRLNRVIEDVSNLKINNIMYVRRRIDDTFLTTMESTSLYKVVELILDYLKLDLVSNSGVSLVKRILPKGKKK